MLRGFFWAVCPHHEEDVWRPVQWSSKNDCPFCLKNVHKPGVGISLLLAFQWKRWLPNGATRADHGKYLHVWDPQPRLYFAPKRMFRRASDNVKQLLS